MKKQLWIITISITAFLFSCRKSDIEDNTAQAITLSIQANFSKEDGLLGLKTSGITVEITNLVSGQKNTVTTNENGIAKFESVPPGNYFVSLTKNYSAEQYLSETNINTTSNVSFNATTTESFNANSNLQFTLVKGRLGDLLIKQFYYAGSNTKTGASFRDEFVEIYNNTDHTIYLDSLYIGNTWQSNTVLSKGGVPLDWSTSPGMTTANGDPNQDFIYARYLFMIPGSGKDHPLESGKSIIIAQTAINHTAPYQLNDANGNPTGAEQTITDPTLTVDLSNADYEVNLVTYTGGTAYKWDVDNPKVPNLDVIHVRSGKDWVLDATGREDVFIFKASTPYTASNWPKYSVPGTPTSFCAQVKVSDVIDAVEVLTPLVSDRTPQRLPVSLDAAGNFVAGGEYSSQSLIRKTVKTFDGRRILQDTNNSGNDFETKTKADPSKSDASFEK